MNIYKVKGWQDNFENKRTREIESCTHVWVPNKQHGLGFTFILSQPDGAAILGIWYLIVEACSMQKKPRHGILTDTGCRDGRPLTVDLMALRWRRRSEEIKRALDVLISEDVGWMEFIEATAMTTTLGRPLDDQSVPLIQVQKQEQEQKQTLSTSGTTPLSLNQEYEEVYKSRPHLKQIHAIPMLRGVTLEIFMKCQQRRHKHLDWDKAIKWVCDKAELQTNIAKPGAFLDTYLGIYEKDHIANCTAREQHAAQRTNDLAKFIEYVAEMRTEYPGRVAEMSMDMKRQYGAEFLKEAEAMLQKAGEVA